MLSPANSSGLKTADGVIVAKPCIYWGMSAGADGTNAATVILYDNEAAASGTVIDKVIVDATATREGSAPAIGVICNKGIYLDIGGIGAEVVVYYSLLT